MTRPDDDAPAEVRVALFTGDRDRLRELFALAEDSPVALASYLAAGRVLVASRGGATVGHLQLVDAGRPRRAEIKNMAVLPALQGRGIGGRLIEAAARLVEEDGGTHLVVATAAADTANLRFYQHHGFRLRSVERDAFTPDRGYPPGLEIDGIPLRDRVWLDRSLAPADPETPAS